MISFYLSSNWKQKTFNPNGNPFLNESNSVVLRRKSYWMDSHIQQSLADHHYGMVLMATLLALTPLLLDGRPLG